ncbi:BCCT family transporter [Christiangramia salexigens]|uniref:Glycine/betaine ABC transporter n=1 Tax=Christiangramia salexigens TaxID=1913577 RepID=A0A1L3J7U8_9FLAO|nr:BCCT family transporter [Christiangramia salexigens]APG61198.1 glycine/betaine ABC transporter [Christiangramia salexigens]
MNNSLLKLFNNTVFIISSLILVLSSAIIFLFTDYFYALIETVSISVREHFGTFYLWLGLICVLFLLILSFSKYGKIKLGKTKPEFDRISWIAMLYSAGMGAGILLRAVQEPVYMYFNPPIKTGSAPEIVSLEYTFYQWGFTAWAFYGVFAVVIGYSIFVEKADIRLSSGYSAFKKIKFFPEFIDTLTILTTVIGVVAAIGLGTTQIEGGISHLLSREPGTLMPNLILVFLICSLAFISAWAGVSKGIKRISNWNILIAVLLMCFVFVTGDISKILLNFSNSFYHYIVDFVPLSLAIGKYDPGVQFLTDWTYYYWAFWLAWAPFTGIFIARISKGRTLREMILGVLLIPSLGSFFWFSVFGTSAFDMINGWSSYNDEFGNVFTSMFVFFESFAFPDITSIVVILLLISFLVTSVDSAIFVLSMFTDKGKQEPSRIYRLAWAILLFLFCEAIIVLGQVQQGSNVLTAMQKFLIITSLPFAFLTVFLLAITVRKLTKKPFI